MKKYFLLILFFISNQALSLVIKEDILTVLYSNIEALIAKNSVDEYRLLMQEVHDKEWHPSIDASVVSLNKKITGSVANSIDRSIQGLDNFLTIPNRVDRADQYTENKFNLLLSYNLYNGYQSSNLIKIQKLLFDKEVYAFKKIIHNLYIEALENNIKLCNEIQKGRVMFEYQKKLMNHISSVDKFTNNKINKMLLNEDLSKLKKDLKRSMSRKNDIKTWFNLSFESTYPINCNALSVKTSAYKNIENEIRSKTYQALINISSTRFNNNKDVKISNLEQQILKLKLKIKGSDYYPKLDFVFNYNKVFNGTNDLKEESHAYGLQLNFPLYKPGHTSGKIISHNRIKRSTYNLRKVNLQVRNNWSKLVNNYKNNIHLLSDIDHQYNRLKLEISRNDIIKKERIKSSGFKYKIDLLKLEKKYLHQEMALIILKIAALGLVPL
ncbi:hypothetical protein THERMOT_2036 [Bathymodiolus thermophilus thioautotrophic gill symbiont]|uniref:TolC family protein n=1 Tax=Bathymodiolus thermophilus thioautotrophic gill symbiont TaxID=2360 RepID=UPI00192C8CAB|nr:TolC family protein [Bathymodiolus thermophilus thioautotrophic gill symbiont]CAB5504835.1 hypothetical protein THERMOT_2036 [Bathymodiolus thermophilus thioautotrophic gill symbiont]